jgi:hypothetical protein
MAKQYKYRKIINEVTTLCLVEPDYELLKLNERVQVIGELDGFTYVEVPDSVTLPTEQPVLLIEANLETDKIDFQTVQKIRAQYSINDELKALRTAVGGNTTGFTTYNAYVEECKAVGTVLKQAVGVK